MHGVSKRVGSVKRSIMSKTKTRKTSRTKRVSRTRKSRKNNKFFGLF